MILNPDTMLIPNLRDGVSSIRNGCHAMKKLSAFIAQFYPVYCESLSPVQILIVQPGVELFFNCISEVGLLVKKATPVFQGIKKADNFVTIADQQP
jgi:hypothetical protein